MGEELGRRLCVSDSGERTSGAVRKGCVQGGGGVKGSSVNGGVGGWVSCPRAWDVERSLPSEEVFPRSLAVVRGTMQTCRLLSEVCSLYTESSESVHGVLQS